jgi:hypothetical protein
MSATVECNHDTRRLTILRRGILNIDDLIESVIRMRAMNVWSYSVLVDAREASTNLLPAEAHTLVAKIRTIGDGRERGPIAVVAADDLTFGMVRMFAALAEPTGMRVSAFRQVSDAERWLQRMSAGTPPASS